MKPLAYAVLLACIGYLMVTPPATAAPTQSSFDGQVARATWLYCDVDGCFDTTMELQVGTFTSEEGIAAEVNEFCVRRDPAPVPTGVSSRIIACASGPGIGSVADDLSAASAEATATIFSRDCTEQDVCFPGSVAPVGAAQLDAAWTATSGAERFSEVDQREVDRLTGAQCRIRTMDKGMRRRADASLGISEVPDESGWVWPLGTLTSASIASIRSVTTTSCKSPT